MERDDDYDIGCGEEDVRTFTSKPTTSSAKMFTWVCNSILGREELAFDNQAEFEKFCSENDVPENLFCLDKYNDLTVKDESAMGLESTSQLLFDLFSKGQYVSRKCDYDIYEWDLDVQLTGADISIN